MLKDVRATETIKFLHMKVIPHYIYMSINYALAFAGVADMKSLVMEF